MRDGVVRAFNWQNGALWQAADEMGNVMLNPLSWRQTTGIEALRAPLLAERHRNGSCRGGGIRRRRTWCVRRARWHARWCGVWRGGIGGHRLARPPRQGHVRTTRPLPGREVAKQSERKREAIASQAQHCIGPAQPKPAAFKATNLAPRRDLASLLQTRPGQRRSNRLCPWQSSRTPETHCCTDSDAAKSHRAGCHRQHCSLTADRTRATEAATHISATGSKEQAPSRSGRQPAGQLPRHHACDRGSNWPQCSPLSATTT